MALSPVELILHYHQQTKHHFSAFARSLGYLDWANQPDPFRRYLGAELVPLPLGPPAERPSYLELFEPDPPAEGQASSPAAMPLGGESLSRFLRHSLALSAWKSHRSTIGASRWALRINPSSGNLHPTEGYLLLGEGAVGDAAPRGPAIAPGLYHYAPEPHALEHRASFEGAALARLLPGFPPGTFLLGLSSIPWREVWKYGERGFRYCQHDVGHALAAVRIGAQLCGWRLWLLDELDDELVAALLGLDRGDEFVAGEPELPELLCAVVTRPAELGAEKLGDCETPKGGRPLTLAVDEARRLAALASWHGRPNRLSGEHVSWPIVEAAGLLSSKPETLVRTPEPAARPRLRPRHDLPLPDDRVGAESLIRRRRSAVAFDGTTGIALAALQRMLAATLPGAGCPFDALERSVLARPRIHLVVFVHRVIGLEPGLYAFLRSGDALAPLRAATHRSFLWQPVPAPVPALASSGLASWPLYLLEAGRVDAVAERVSCDQSIAGEGAFALAMLAEFGPAIRTHGAWLYRRLFWEAGLVGQVLYLEAEAARVRATGIGCYYDDPLHELVGLESDDYQSLYHFTVGGPVEDRRLTTEPAYPEGETR